MSSEETYNLKKTSRKFILRFKVVKVIAYITLLFNMLQFSSVVTFIIRYTQSLLPGSDPWLTVKVIIYLFIILNHLFVCIRRPNILKMTDIQLFKI